MTLAHKYSVLRIGDNSIWGTFFTGRIDQVRAYNRALTVAEINTDMNRPVAASSPSITLVGAQTVEPLTDSNPQGEAQAFQTMASVTGLMASLSVYVDSGSTGSQFVSRLYKDNNGHPGTLLAQGTLALCCNPH